MTLNLIHQQVIRSLPQIVRYSHGDEKASVLGLLKIYQRMFIPDYFILYVLPNASIIKITSMPVECPHALD